jgi:hypothetical protein
LGTFSQDIGFGGTTHQIEIECRRLMVQRYWRQT